MADNILGHQIQEVANSTADVEQAQIAITNSAISGVISGEGAGNTVQATSSQISPNFQAGTRGWRISANGDVEFNDGIFRGQLIAGSIDIPNTTTANSFHVDSSGNIWAGATTFGAAPFSVSSAGVLTASGATITGTITATTGTIGGFSIGSDYIKDTADSMGLASTVSGSDDVRFWAGDTFTNRATADFRVTESGAVVASNITVTGGSVTTSVLSGTVGLSNLNIANRGWSQSSVFSVTDADTIAWGAGTFTAADGTSYLIDAGNTGNMVAKTYIYLDTAVSTTAYQTTTTASTAVGAGKVLIASAQNGTTEATYSVFFGQGGQNIDAAQIVAGSITANEIAASTITGSNIATLNISGKNATFDTGSVGGWTMSANSLSAGSGSATVGLDTTVTGGDDVRIYAGSATPSSAPFRVLESGAVVATNATISGAITATTGAIGGFDIGADYIRDAADSMGLASTVTGGDDIRFWAGAAFASRSSAPFRVSESGEVTASNVIVTGGSISSTPISSIPNNSSTDISLLEKTWTMAFSVTDADTVAWSSGSMVLSNGRTFTIDAGNTGNMSALTYIYLDPSVSSTVLQTTTTASTALGANKALIGTAQNNTVTASFIPYGPGQPLVDGANIGALSIVANNIAASTITASKLSVSQLSAITADLGSITAGTIVLPSGGYIRSGQTAYDTGTGFYLGNDSGTPKFSIGNSAGNKLTWNGTALAISGSVTATSGAIGGFDVGSDYIRDSANSMGLASTVTGGDDVRFWAGSTYANRASANLRIHESGDMELDYGASITLIQGGDVRFTSVTAPGACTAALIATGTGNIENGTHTYKITFVNAAGETELGTASNTVTVDASNKQVSLTAIPVSSSSSVISRKIYRTKAGFSQYYLLATIADNSTTTYTDNISDTNLTGEAANNKENDSFGKTFIDNIESISIGAKNTYVGYSTGTSNTTGSQNTGIGAYSLTANTYGDSNTGIGFGTLRATTGGAANTAVGQDALRLNTTGNYNVAVGTQALYNNVGGGYNVGIGYDALFSVVGGALNTAVGRYALGSVASGSNNVAIGYYAGAYETGSDTLYIDNQNRTDTTGDKTKALIYGVFASAAANQKLTINGLLNQSVSKTPSSASDTGTTGDIAWDTNYIYVCTTTNAWKRVAIATW